MKGCLFIFIGHGSSTATFALLLSANNSTSTEQPQAHPAVQ
jgi:hypothetical protein